jgi:hypothetical protein
VRGRPRDQPLIEREFEPFYGNLRRVERPVEENENGYRRIHRQRRPRRLSIAFAAAENDGERPRWERRSTNRTSDAVQLAYNLTA